MPIQPRCRNCAFVRYDPNQKNKTEECFLNKDPSFDKDIPENPEAVALVKAGIPDICEKYRPSEAMKSNVVYAIAE